MIKKLLKKITPTNELEINSEFSSTFAKMENTDENLFITGKAGTGKSTLIQYFRRRSVKKIVILAPTGLAAINVNGQTVHSFFHFPPKFISKSDLRISNNRMFKEVDTVIIDEASMLRADTLDAIDNFLKLNGRDKDMPFGGIQIILVGDLFQLPPIIKSEDAYVYSQIYKTPYFFDSNAYHENSFKKIELQTIYRQKDEKFIRVLNKIRSGEVTSEDLEIINARVITKDDNPNIRSHLLSLTTTNKVAEGVNEMELEKINNPDFHFMATISGDFPTENRSLPVEVDLKLKKGAKVMFVKNDPGKRWVNGSLGIVEALTNETIKIKIENEPFKDTVEVEQMEWHNIKYEFDEKSGEVIAQIMGTLTQFPLRLAWAITIHKSQGMTFDEVNVDFSRSPFAHGQTYVALSRCRTLKGLRLTKKIWPNDVIVDEEIIEFSNS